MPATARRVLGALVAVVGLMLAVIGAWLVVLLGPSGEARFSATLKAPGVVVIPPDVLNAVDVPVRVTATRRDGGAIFLAAGPTLDAHAVLAGSAVSTVSGVHYPSESLDLRASGAGALTDIGTADIWRLSAKGARSAQLLVDQGSSSGNNANGSSGTGAGRPETAVVASGDASALKDVTMTLTWADRRWFFEALAVAVIGAVMAAFALNDLWQRRAVRGRTDPRDTSTSGATG